MPEEDTLLYKLPVSPTQIHFFFFVRMKKYVGLTMRYSSFSFMVALPGFAPRTYPL